MASAELAGLTVVVSLLFGKTLTGTESSALYYCLVLKGRAMVWIELA